MGDEKLLTIAIPTFNGGNALLEAIESCKHIKLDDEKFEILIVDNCSTDNSIALIQNKFFDFSAIRLIINETNLGRIQNWNRCLELAKGKYILFLFTNDLINKKNYVKESLEFFENYPESALLSVPWIISDFKMEKMIKSFQYYQRTPGIGQYQSDTHIKSVIENGKLPFVCLQSNFIRTKYIKEFNITFNPNYSITSDGIFLSELAMTTEKVSFYNHPSVIWRQDAPNRMHSNVKYFDHIEQFYDTFLIINRFFKRDMINISKAFANYRAYEYIILNMIKKTGKIKDSKDIFHLWINLIKRGEIRKIVFQYFTLLNIFGSFLKIPILVKLYQKN